MTRSLVGVLLTVAAGSLWLCAHEAAAQQPHSMSYGSPRPVVGTYLGPSAAYPTAPGYYSGPTAYSHPAMLPRASAGMYSHGTHRVSSAETRAEPAPGAAVQAPPAYANTPCQCERCRRARGEEDGGLSGVLRGLWELEQRKNAFLGRIIFGD